MNFVKISENSLELMEDQQTSTIKSNILSTSFEMIENHQNYVQKVTRIDSEQKRGTEEERINIRNEIENGGV